MDRRVWWLNEKLTSFHFLSACSKSLTFFFLIITAHSYYFILYTLFFNISHRRKCVTFFMLPPSKIFSQGYTSKVYLVRNHSKWMRDYFFDMSNVNVTCRGRAFGSEDEKTGSKVRPSPPGASDWEAGNPSGIFLLEQTQLSFIYLKLNVCYLMVLSFW